MPALFTKISMRPVRCSTDSTNSCAAASWVRSAANAITRLPVASSSLARSWIRSVVDVIATCAPAACSFRAIANPIPSAPPAPVTIAVCPSRFIALGRYSTPSLVVQVHARFDGAFRAGNLQQLRIKLHERMLHRGVLVMTFPAIIPARRHRARGISRAIEIEVRPLVREPRFVFDFDVQALEIRLVAAMFVDRAARGRAVDLQYKHGLVRPLAVGCKIVIRRRRDDNVRETLRSARALVVDHAKAGRNVHPAPVTLRAQEFAVFRKLRLSGGTLRLARSGKQPQKDAGGSKNAYQQAFLHRTLLMSCIGRGCGKTMAPHAIAVDDILSAFVSILARDA